MPTATFDRHELESGAVLRDVPVAYETWGTLAPSADNVILVCHALTGSADASDWWEGLIGPGKALDTNRYFVVCPNALGSPYGTASPVTENPDTGRAYGAAFPDTTIRDTVRLHRRLLWRLGVKQVAAAVGGSMGAMQVLEWGFYGSTVRSLIPIAVGGRHSPWQIGWSEAQRQAIYADPNWNGGDYSPDAPPSEGLASARMMAMVSYRSRASFEERFGRNRQPDNGTPAGSSPPFAIESYLRYHGEKLTDRFDANCYVALTKQMDTHDVSRGRGAYLDVLASLSQPTLVVGIDSDVLYPLEEQKELATHIPNATLEVLRAPHGHDAFLIEQDALARKIRSFLADRVPRSAAEAA